MYAKNSSIIGHNDLSLAIFLLSKINLINNDLVKLKEIYTCHIL